MNELEIIERLRQRAATGVTAPGLALGIGDDCAIYRPGPGEELLFTTDLLIEGVHFRPGDAPRRVGRKALARGLSDIAAMGGEPRWCLISLAAPDESFITAFYDGVLELATSTGTAIAGGDLARVPHPLCDVVVCGICPEGEALRRDGARPGDVIRVSGPLGRAASRNFDDDFVPRLNVGRALRGVATACMDLSDGFAIDLHRLCAASGVGAAIEDVPVFAGASVDQALFGGEDYELLYTTPAGVDAPGIRVGAVTDAGISFRGAPLPAKGWDHFS